MLPASPTRMTGPLPISAPGRGSGRFQRYYQGVHGQGAGFGQQARADQTHLFGAGEDAVHVAGWRVAAQGRQSGQDAATAGQVVGGAHDDVVVLDAEVGQVKDGRRRDGNVVGSGVGQADAGLALALVAVVADGFGGQTAAGGQDDLQGNAGGECAGRYAAGGVADEVVAIASDYLKAGMVHVGHEGDGRDALGVRAGDAGDDVAEVVGAPGCADFGERGADGGCDAVLVEGDGRLRAEAGEEVEGAGVVVGCIGSHSSQVVTSPSTKQAPNRSGETGQQVAAVDGVISPNVTGAASARYMVMVVCSGSAFQTWRTPKAEPHFSFATHFRVGIAGRLDFHRQVRG